MPRSLHLHEADVADIELGEAIVPSSLTSCGWSYGLVSVTLPCSSANSKIWFIRSTTAGSFDALLGLDDDLAEENVWFGSAAISVSSTSCDSLSGRVKSVR